MTPKKRTRLQQHRLPLGGEDDEKTVIYTDGASRGNPGDAGIGVVFQSGKTVVEKIKLYIGKKTNNQAEYEALITALEKAKELGKSHLHIFTDSQLLANQITGKWQVKDQHLGKLHRKAKDLIRNFEDFTITHIRREQNREADRLANQAIDDYLKSRDE
jgi:ribonuclease HI